MQKASADRRYVVRANYTHLVLFYSHTECGFFDAIDIQGNAEIVSCLKDTLERTDMFIA